jgi:ribose-phosphate pyrophosphokinase
MENFLLVSPNCADIAKPNIELRRFPDGEVYVRIPSVGEIAGKEVSILHRCYPHPNESLIQLSIILHEVSKVAKKTTIAVPYLPYARADKEWLTGEAKSIDTICAMLKTAGADELVTFDCHFLKKEGRFEREGLKINNISMGKAVISELRKHSPGAVVISPDKGAGYLVADFGGMSMKKERGDYEKSGDVAFRKIEKLEADFNVWAQNIIIIDDMIAGGGTMVKAMEKCREEGAKRIMCGATHGLFLNDGLERLKEAGAAHIVVTDSIPSLVSSVKIVGELKAAGIPL